MYTLQNSKGEARTIDARFRENGKVISEGEFNQIMEQKYNCKRFRGLELMNANGDIAQSGLAYQYATDRLSFIRSKIVEQTFYEVAPADYLDVIPGEGAFAGNIITNLSIKTAGGFRQGKINVAGHNSRLQIADAAVSPVMTYVANWALGVEYSIFDVNQAAFAGNWDIVEAKHRARKKDWDLGIQEVAFLGDIDDLTNFPGLLTQPNVNSNTAVITKKISSMTADEFNTFVALIIGAYLTNTNQTAYPNMFVIPQDDYAGLAAPVSATYPMVSKLEYLQKAFNAIVPNGKVQILPSAYGMAMYNKTAINVSIGKARYALYKKDIDTVFMEIPVDFQTTQVGTINNFNFQDVAFGQYCGPTALKPREILYFDF